MDYEEAKGESRKKGVKSNLPKKVQDLMKFIFDMNLVEKNMINVGYDANKMPLGRVSKDTLANGYLALKKIEKELLTKNSREKLNQLSSEFYCFIPHSFKNRNMLNFVINTKEKLKEKTDLLNMLNEIQISAEISGSAPEDKDIHEHDIKYRKLKCKIESLNSKSKEYKELIKSLDIDHSSTNCLKFECIEIFKLCREGESEKFKKDIGNRKLLWHGSNFSNWGGILSHGLRIAPPEVPSCGFMFGKGVYFTDVVHKAADYSAFLNSNKIGLIALCDVALGQSNDLIDENESLSLETLPQGAKSTKGCGQFVPTLNIDLNGSKLQLGPLKDEGNNYNLTHNEYIVYDEDQIQLKYLFMLEFKI